MAGGKITRIVGGKSTTIVEENFTGYYKNLKMNAGGKNIFTARQTHFGTPKEPEKKDGYFVKGWWSSDSEGKEKINEALIGETVYFHVETRGIPDGEKVRMTLWDDDVKRAEEEKDDTQGSDKIELYPIGTTDHSKDNESKYGIVHNNKIVRMILLNDYFAKLIEEEDKAIELFFACSYNGQNIELPLSFEDYLKVRESAPLIIFVNGYWNTSWIQKDLFGFSDGKFLQDYWGIMFRDRAINYFSKDSKVYFINGADVALSSGQQRFKNGEKFAEERLKNTDSKFYKEIYGLKRRIMIVSHSMGAAFSEGVLNILKKQNIFVEKIIHFSPADVSDFFVTFPEKTYQIDISFDPVLSLLKNINDKSRINNVKFTALVQNPDHDQYGHANTKLESYVWNWFEDLEKIELNFSHEDIEYRIIHSDLGPYTTIPIKKVFYNSTNLKHNTQFISIFKGEDLYSYHSDNVYYKVTR